MKFTRDDVDASILEIFAEAAGVTPDMPDEYLVDALIAGANAMMERHHAQEEARPHAAPDDLEGAGGTAGRD